jgi:hypothetical protein
MSDRTPRAAWSALALAALLAASAAPQALAAAAKAPAMGDPHDITGAWDRYPAPGDSGLDPTVKERPSDVPPPPLKPEYLPAYEAHMKEVAEANAKGQPIATGYTHCIPDGMPAMMMGMFPMEVLQSKGQVTIIQEAYNQVRRIYLGEKAPPIEDAEPGFWGHSGGRWNGDVLEVETVGLKDYVRYKDVPHSDQMRIFEKIRKIDANHFEDQITVTDPVYLTGPWTWTWMYKRRPGYKMQEYVCEDNREYADPATGLARLRVGQPEQ